MEGVDYTGLILEARKNAWYYIMPGAQHMHAFGPFSCDEFAVEHMRRNHPNPGTWRVLHLAPGQSQMDLSEHPLLVQYIDRAGFSVDMQPGV
jgi:hypothetical protein